MKNEKKPIISGDYNLANTPLHFRINVCLAVVLLVAIVFYFVGNDSIKAGRGAPDVFAMIRGEGAAEITGCRSDVADAWLAMREKCIDNQDDTAVSFKDMKAAMQNCTGQTDAYFHTKSC